MIEIGDDFHFIFQRIKFQPTDAWCLSIVTPLDSSPLTYIESQSAEPNKQKQTFHSEEFHQELEIEYNDWENLSLVFRVKDNND